MQNTYATCECGQNSDIWIGLIFTKKKIPISAGYLEVSDYKRVGGYLFGRLQFDIWAAIVAKFSGGVATLVTCILGEMQVTIAFRVWKKKNGKKNATRFQWVDPIYLCTFQQHFGGNGKKAKKNTILGTVQYLKYGVSLVILLLRPLTNFNNDGHAVASGNGIPTTTMAKIECNNQLNVFNIILGKL